MMKGLNPIRKVKVITQRETQFNTEKPMTLGLKTSIPANLSFQRVFLSKTRRTRTSTRTKNQEPYNT